MWIKSKSYIMRTSMHIRITRQWARDF